MLRKPKSSHNKDDDIEQSYLRHELMHTCLNAQKLALITRLLTIQKSTTPKPSKLQEANLSKLRSRHRVNSEILTALRHKNHLSELSLQMKSHIAIA